MRRAATLALVTVTALTACTDEATPVPGDPDYPRDPALDVDNRSAHGDQRSHNRGLNCMTCHQALGPGRGQFTLGVTVVDPDGVPAVDPVLELYTGPMASGGVLLVTIEGDALGNVFTTDPLPFPDQPLFPVVRSRDGTTRNAMPFPTISGACNLCHKPGFEVRLQAASPS